MHATTTYVVGLKTSYWLSQEDQTAINVGKLYVNFEEMHKSSIDPVYKLCACDRAPKFNHEFTFRRVREIRLLANLDVAGVYNTNVIFDPTLGPIPSCITGRSKPQERLSY